MFPLQCRKQKQKGKMAAMALLSHIKSPQGNYVTTWDSFYEVLKIKLPEEAIAS